MVPPPLLFALFFLVLGAIVGSFGNVCVHRLPRGESIVFPASHCPSCQQPIAFYDNVPVLSWLLLRGHCRRCRAPISLRYPLLEASVALLFLLAALRFGPTLLLAQAALLSASAVILIASDLEHRDLPDEVTIGTLVLGLGVAGLRDLLEREAGAPFVLRESFVNEAALGAVLGASLLLLVRIGYQLLRGVEGMGLGDVKMLAMIGALGGPLAVFVTLLFGSFGGGLAGGMHGVLRRLVWRRARRQADSASEGARGAAARHGFLIDETGLVRSASERWTTIPGAAPIGQPFTASAGAARPLVAFVRLARRRARAGQPTAVDSLFVDDGEFFRILAVRAAACREGLLVFVGRSDIPFGVFLGIGSLLAFAFGRAVLTWLVGWVPPSWAKLLP